MTETRILTDADLMDRSQWEIHTFRLTNGTSVDARIHVSVPYLVIDVDTDGNSKEREYPLFIRREFSLDDALWWKRHCGGEIWERLQTRSFAPMS